MLVQFAHGTELQLLRVFVFLLILVVRISILEEAQPGIFHAVQQRVPFLADSPPLFLDSFLVLLGGTPLGGHLRRLHVVAVPLRLGARRLPASPSYRRQVCEGTKYDLIHIFLKIGTNFFFFCLKVLFLLDKNYFE